MSKIIITGVTGYIGSKLVRKLLNENNIIYALIQEHSKLNSIDDIKDNINIIKYNKSIKDLIKLFNDIKPDLVFHIASLFIPQHEADDINNLIQSNIEFGTYILEAMAKSDTKRIINTGTIWQNYIDENYNPTCLYAATKEAFEKILEYYVEAENFNAITLKLFDTYGCDDPRNKILSFFDKISKTGEIIDMTSGEQYMDLVYIDDVVEAFISASNLTSNDSKQHKKYFVKTGNTIKLKDLAALYEKVFNAKLNINWGSKEYRKREIMKPYEDGETLPNWKPNLMVEDGLKYLYSLKQNNHSNEIDTQLENIKNLIQLQNIDEACNQYIKLIDDNNGSPYLAKVYKSFAEFLFNCECYEESLDMFVNAYELDYMKDDIENFISKMFLEPNLEYFKDCYKNNLLKCEDGETLLEKFPFENLPLDFIPTLQNKYYIFDKQEHKFKNKYSIMNYSNSSYLEYKYVEDEFSDIVIYEQWNYENIRKYLRAFMDTNRKVYIVSNNLLQLVSFLKFSDEYKKELKGIKFFSSLEEFKNFFEINSNIYLPFNVISEYSTKKEELNSIISDIHQKRITKEYRDESNILLTICIPSYNRGHRALTDIEELLKLKYDSEIEFLVSNNGSVNNVEGYKKIQTMDDARISYYEFETSQGFSGNIVNVIKNAKGKFLLLISDEDMVINSKLPYYMRRLKNSKKVALLSTKTAQTHYRKNTHLKKGTEAILNFMLTNNYISGTMYNNELIKNNNLNTWLEQKQIESNNYAFNLYTHEFLDIALANLGDIIIDETNFVIQGKAEKSEIIVDNKKGSIDNDLNIPTYALYEFRLKELKGWCELIKEIANKDNHLMRNMFIKVCNKIFFLVSIVKAQYISHGENWNEICEIIYNACLENIEFLYKDIPLPTKANDKKIVEKIKDSYLDK